MVSVIHFVDGKTADVAWPQHIKLLPGWVCVVEYYYDSSFSGDRDRFAYPSETVVCVETKHD